jgi:signal transduction histidine kinase
MSHSDPSVSKVLSQEVKHETRTRLQGPWLILARLGWGVFVMLTLGLFFLSMPGYYHRLRTLSSSVVYDPNIVRAGLAHLGLSADFFAGYSFAIVLLLVLISCLVGGVIVWYKSNDWMALLTAFVLVAYGAQLSFAKASSSWFNTLLIDYPRLSWAVAVEIFIWDVTVILLCLLLPNGQFVPRWTRWLILPIAVLAVLNAMNKVQFIFPSVLYLLVILSVFCIMAASQIYRYRRVSNVIQRQQTKWLVVFAVLALIGWIGFNGASLIFPTLNQDVWLYNLVLPPIVTLIEGLVPVAIGIAVLRYKLFAIDLILNRALLWGTLSASVIGIFALIIGVLSRIFNQSGQLVIAVVAASVVAALILPLYTRLQRSVDHLFYGKRAETDKVLKQLSKRLEAVKPDEALRIVVETTAGALKLPFVAIAIKDDDIISPVVTTGTLTMPTISMPLTYQMETVGELLLAPHAPGEEFTADEWDFLHALGSQAALAVHTVRLMTELQHSRQHLVTTREEERLRLRRDLHDGLGPLLSTIMHKVGLVRAVYRCQPETADALLSQLEDEIELVMGDLKGIVYNLRPPELDELGLVGAVRAFVARLGNEAQANHTVMHVTVEAPDQLPPLSAAVEVAAYRIVQEALTNVIRHAQAHSCRVSLSVEEALEIEVYDDGKGFAQTARAGVGLTSMRERAEELGGVFIIAKDRPGGLQITARLPLAPSARESTSVQ